MPKYAQYNATTGEVVAIETRAEGMLLLAEEPPKSGTYFVTANAAGNPRLEHVPVVYIEPAPPPEGGYVAGQAVAIVVLAPDPGSFERPEAWRLMINGQEGWWDGKSPLVPSAPGTYDIRIIGPKPWSSNKITITVLPPAVDSAEAAGSAGILPA